MTTNHTGMLEITFHQLQVETKCALYKYLTYVLCVFQVETEGDLLLHLAENFGSIRTTKCDI